MITLTVIHREEGERVPNTLLGAHGGSDLGMIGSR